jgi:surfactin synthase thioesterase subunit
LPAKAFLLSSISPPRRIARATAGLYNPRNDAAAAPDLDFIAHLRELGATPPEVFGSPELLDLMLPILRSDFRACETYVPSARHPLQTAIAVYGGLADEDTSCASLRAWEHETTGVCVVRMFPGGHFFLRDSASKLVAMLEHDLANAFKMHRAESHGLRCQGIFTEWNAGKTTSAAK